MSMSWRNCVGVLVVACGFGLTACGADDSF